MRIRIPFVGVAVAALTVALAACSTAGSPAPATGSPEAPSPTIVDAAATPAVVSTAPTAGPAASPAAGSGGTANATVVDFAFDPPVLTVKVGTTVTWTNSGDAPHTVTADGGSFTSATLQHGATFNQAFATAGTFAYHCAIHSSMTAAVVVTRRFDPLDGTAPLRATICA